MNGIVVCDSSEYVLISLFWGHSDGIVTVTNQALIFCTMIGGELGGSPY